MSSTSRLRQLLNGSRGSVQMLAFATLGSIAGALNAQTSVLLPAARDVPLGYHDNYNTANTNYNSGLQFAAYSTAGTQGGENNNRSLVDFDLSVIPPGADILGAFLNLTALGPFGLGPVGTVGSIGQNSSTLRRVTDAWEDDVVTWNTQPATTMQNAVPLAQSTYALQNYHSIDVTALVQDMVADPSNSYGFMLMLDDETPECGLVFHSGLAVHPDQRPSLLVVYGECGVGMAEQTHDQSALQVSPNIGAPGELMLLNMPGATEQPARLDVLDAAGRLVWSGPVRQWPVSWTVPALSQGAYTLTAMDRDGHALGTARAIVR